MPPIDLAACRSMTLSGEACSGESVKRKRMRRRKPSQGRAGNGAVAGMARGEPCLTQRASLRASLAIRL